MSRLADLQAFLDQLLEAKTPQELARLVEALTREMGFDKYAIMEWADQSTYRTNLDHMKRGEMVVLVNHSDAWAEHYTRNNFVEIDPILDIASRTSVGFCWHDALKTAEMTAEQRALLEAYTRADIGEGFTVPIHLPGHPSGSSTFSMRVGRSLPVQNLPAAQLVGTFAFEAARSLVMKADLRQRVRLTDRQIECAILMGRGFTEADAAKRLGISEETVKRHLKEARMAYGVSKSVQVVLRLLYDGQITLRELIK